MALALPGARGLFGAMQHAITQTKSSNRISLTKNTHQAIDDFRTLAAEVVSRPTRIAELIPLRPSVVGTHDASGLGAGGVFFASPHIARRAEPLTLPPQNIIPDKDPATLVAAATPWATLAADSGTASHAVSSYLTAPSQNPIVWRLSFPSSIRAALVTANNPNGTITNSDLELAGSLLQNAAEAACLDIRERTILNFSDNTPTVFWQRKGSVTSVMAATNLLRLQAYHQRLHGYVPRTDYITGPHNRLADDASRLPHLSDSQFLTHFSTLYPQKLPWRLWTPSPQLYSAVISALLNKPCDLASVQAATKLPLPIGRDGEPSVHPWPSTPYSTPSKIRSRFSKSSLCATAVDKSAATQSGDAQWKVPYGRLAKRLPVWGPPTHALHPQTKWISA